MPEWFLDEAHNLTHTEVMLWLSLLRHGGRWDGKPLDAMHHGLRPRSVADAAKSLERRGLIRRAPGQPPLGHRGPVGSAWALVYEPEIPAMVAANSAAKLAEISDSAPTIPRAPAGTVSSSTAPPPPPPPSVQAQILQGLQAVKMTEMEAWNYVTQKGPNWWNRALYGLWSLWDRLHWTEADPLRSPKGWVKAEAKGHPDARVEDTEFLEPLIAYLEGQAVDNVTPFRREAR